MPQIFEPPDPSLARPRDGETARLADYATMWHPSAVWPAIVVPTAAIRGWIGLRR